MLYLVEVVWIVKKKTKPKWLAGFTKLVKADETVNDKLY